MKGSYSNSSYSLLLEELYPIPENILPASICISSNDLEFYSLHPSHTTSVYSNTSAMNKNVKMYFDKCTFTKCISKHYKNIETFTGLLIAILDM
jgi:hypothetical protein